MLASPKLENAWDRAVQEELEVEAALDRAVEAAGGPGAAGPSASADQAKSQPDSPAGMPQVQSGA